MASVYLILRGMCMCMSTRNSTKKLHRIWTAYEVSINGELEDWT